MHLFLTSSTDCTYATLPPDESKHCIRVLRMLPGDEIWVTSGDGVLCTARIVDPDPTACQVEITQRIPNYGAHPYHIHIAVAPTKNNARLEWFVEKAVEIGIDRMAKEKIEYYFAQSTQYLARVNVPEERKQELIAYTHDMMKREK